MRPLVLLTLLIGGITSCAFAFGDDLQSACKAAGVSDDTCTRANSVYNKEHDPALSSLMNGKLSQVDQARIVAQVQASGASGHGNPNPFASAQTCCQNADACQTQLSDSMSNAAKAELNQFGKKGTSSTAQINAAATQSGAVNQTKADLQSSVTGACLARKQICSEFYLNWQSKVDSAACGDACTIAHNMIADSRSKCDGLSTDSMQAALTALQGAVAGDNNSAGASSGNNSTDPGSQAADSSNSDGKSSSGSGINPQSLSSIGQALQSALQGQQTTPSQEVTDCSNTAIAGCMQAQPNSWNTGNPSTSSLQPSSTSAGGFNPASTSSNLPNPGLAIPTAGTNANPPVGGPGVPNGGGAIPSSQGGAQLGTPNGPQAQLGPSGRADILHGDQSRSAPTGGSGGGGGFNNVSGYSNPVNNLGGESYDLGSLLQKPGRMPAGADLRPMRAEINTPGVNIWNRISDHIKTRCTQGLLRDCGP